MKQIRLFMAMMLCVMSIGAWAATDKFACNAAPFTTTTSNASYSNGTFSWTAGNSNSMSILKNLKGNVDLSKYKYLVVKTHERNADFRIIIYCDNNGSTSSYIGIFNQDEIQLDLTQITLTTSGHNYANINNIHIAGYGNSGSLKIVPEDIYLETESYEMMSFSTTINDQSDVNTPFGWYKLNGENLQKRGQAVTNSLGTTTPANSIIFGYNSNDYSESATGYMDLTGYSKVTVELNAYDGTKNGQVRLLNAENQNHQAINGFSADKLAVTADLTVTKCATIKPGSVASTCQDIKGITFEGSFIPEHTTAWTFPHDVSNTKVVYDRTFTPGQMATICVPFNMSATDAAKVGEFYELVSFANGVLGFNRVAEPLAYVPYLIKPADATPMTTLGRRTLRAYENKDVTVGDVIFCGTMQYTDDLSKAGYDLYGYDAADGEFVKVGSDVQIKAFRAYIAIPAGTQVSPRLRVVTGTSVATGLDQVQDAREAVYYNVMGQRVSRDTKGIVICNGKKFINMSNR